MSAQQQVSEHNLQPSYTFPPHIHNLLVAWLPAPHARVAQYKLCCNGPVIFHQSPLRTEHSL